MKGMRRGAAALSALLLLWTAGCAGGGTSGAPEDTEQQKQARELTVSYGAEDTDVRWEEETACRIVCDGAQVQITGSGAEAAGTAIRITAAGTYLLRGSLAGSVQVEAGKKETVRLVLDGVRITCEDGPAVWAKQAQKLIVTLADGTENALTDGETYTVGDGDEPSAALFAKCDCTLNGTGKLTVCGRHNDGITGKDELRLCGGTVEVTAADDGLIGRDLLAVCDTVLTVQAGGDGMKATNDTDAERGNIVITSGTLDITAGTDGIEAAGTLKTEGGAITLLTGGGSANGRSHSDRGLFGGGTQAAASSAKGLKAGRSLYIGGGTVSADTADDCLHSDDALYMVGGALTLRSGDDGMHADTSLRIEDGTVNITKSYEGIESLAITLAGGQVHIVASDDGLNAAGGNDGSGLGGRPGAGHFSGDNGSLRISGGYIFIDAAGDGVDSNGTIEMSGGTLLVNGPTDSANGALDFESRFTFTGGVLAAAGSAGMAQSPTADGCCCVTVTLASAQSGGTPVALTDADGTVLFGFVPAKAYQSVVLCAPALTAGTAATCRVGGTAEATEDGLLTGGTVSGGTVSGTVTLAAGNVSVGNGGFGPGGPGGNPGGPGGDPGGPGGDPGGPGGPGGGWRPERRGF